MAASIKLISESDDDDATPPTVAIATLVPVKTLYPQPDFTTSEYSGLQTRSRNQV